MTEPVQPPHNAGNDSKESYRPPQFKHLGQVESFTQAGSPSSSEVAGRLSGP